MTPGLVSAGDRVGDRSDPSGPITGSGGVVVDLFAGAGGWDAAAGGLGVGPVVGIDHDPAACATRRAAGLLTIRADLHHFTVSATTSIVGLVASPPCQVFSQAGNRQGATALPGLLAALEESGWVWPDRGFPTEARLVWLVFDWWDRHRPRWVAAEQVPSVLPFWDAIADQMRTAGYRAWAGIVDAADYGVPQNRQRAVLLAHAERAVHRPEPTHGRDPHPVLFGTQHQPWVSMAQALDWARNRARPLDEPAPTVTVSAVDRNWCWDRPATTVTTDTRVWPPGHKLNRYDLDRLGHTRALRCYHTRSGRHAIRVTPAEAAALQTFPPDWPWQGSKAAQARQIGNAIPPLLARHFLHHLTT
jgi:DNA (cytosine-5)-methyltransferase 1